MPVALVPAGLVTVTSTTAPGLPGGAVTERLVSEATVRAVAATPPNCTSLAAARCDPVTVTMSPPVAEPTSGVTPEMTGGVVGAGYTTSGRMAWVMVPAASATVTVSVSVAARKGAR